MSKIKGDEPAFPKPLDPYPNTSGTANLSGHPGMDQRTWLAGSALGSGDIGRVAFSFRNADLDRHFGKDSCNISDAMKLAAAALDVADALIVLLNAEPGHDR